MLTSSSTNLIVVSSVVPSLAVIAVTLRFIARGSVKSGFRADDYVVLAALVTVVGGGAMTIYGALDGGEGEPMLELFQDPDKAARFAKILFAGPMLFAGTLSLVKISTVLLYKRIFVRKSFHIACNIMLGLITGWFLASILGPLFSTNPIADSWTRPGHTVINLGALLVSLAAINLALDLATLSLPLFVISTLHMTLRRKILVTGIFWLGLFCVVASVIRLHYFIIFTQTPLGPDTAYSSLTINLIVWSITESGTSVIAACLPTMAPLFRGIPDLGSLLQSVRSRLSLRSMSSKGSSNGTRASETTTTQETKDARHAWQQLRSTPTQQYSFEGNNAMEMQSADIYPYHPQALNEQKTFRYENHMV